jgi:hypothetical protein
VRAYQREQPVDVPVSGVGGELPTARDEVCLERERERQRERERERERGPPDLSQCRRLATA